jgi:hypothetical protein
MVRLIDSRDEKHRDILQSTKDAMEESDEDILLYVKRVDQGLRRVYGLRGWETAIRDHCEQCGWQVSFSQEREIEKLITMERETIFTFLLQKK